MAKRLIRRQEFQSRLGVGATTFYGMIQAGAIPPPDARLGYGPNAPVAWLESTVEHVVEQLVERERQRRTASDAA